MRSLKIPPQVMRLVLLTVGIVGCYLVARHLLTPASFGELGFFRANAMLEAASYEPTYAGAAACGECHPDEQEALGGGGHHSLSCEACHGAGQAHADDPDQARMTILTFSHCVRCHEASPSRPKWHKQILLHDHYAGDACVECHLPHRPNDSP